MGILIIKTPKGGLAMEFTTPCFIRKNTERLRESLKIIGIRPFLSNEGLNAMGSNIKVYGRVAAFSCSDSLNNCQDYIDCGTNEELFLAIASLRNDSDIHQWFTDGEKWVISDIHSLLDLKEYFQLIKFDYSKTHKATAEELIKHFNS